MSRRREWTALSVLVLVSTALRAWASRGVSTLWIMPDAGLYGLLGQDLYREGSLSILGEPVGYYSAIFPALAGLPLSLGDPVLGHSILKVLQALVMSLTAVPVYLWGRSLMARRWAFAAAVLTLAVPGLAYSGLIMSEVAFYPVFVLAAWAMAAMLAEPTPARQALFVGAVCLAFATRFQAVVLVPAFLTAILFEALLARRRPQLARLAPSLGGLALLGMAWFVWRLGSGQHLLAGYAGVTGSYDAVDAMRFVVHHATDLVLLGAVFPVCALLLLLWTGFGAGETDPRARVFLAVAGAATLWLVVQVGVFASREVDMLAERNLFFAAPLVFLAFGLWLGRGGPGSTWARSVVGVAVAAAILVLPLTDFVIHAARPNAFTLAPLYDRLALINETQVALALAVGVLMVLPRRLLPALVPVALILLAFASVSASQMVVEEARAQQERVVGPERRWVDATADGPVAYVFAGESDWTAVWETAFWNRRIRWVYTLPGTTVAGQIPQHEVEVEPDGELRLGGGASQAEYAVAGAGLAFRGERVADSPQHATGLSGVELWRLERPLRLSTLVSGVGPDGSVFREAVLTAYDCGAGGTFEAVLRGTEPRTASVLLDGRLLQSKTLESAQTWRVRVPIAPRRGARACELSIVPNGRLIAIRLAFERRALPDSS